MQPAKTNATYQDVLDAPEHMRAELIDGNLYLQGSPRGNHQLISQGLAGTLGPPLNRASGWVILRDVELHLPKTLVPDLSGWRAERFTEPLDSPRFEVVPDWVCEVLSPGTKGYDRGLKRRHYFDAGVDWLWYVDPVERLIEAYERHETGYMLLDTATEAEPRALLPFPLSIQIAWTI